MGVGPAPFRLSGLPEGAGAAEAGWGDWQARGFTPAGPQALNSMEWGWGALQSVSPSSGRTLVSSPSPPGARTHMPFFAGVPECPRPSRPPSLASSNATSQRQWVSGLQQAMPGMTKWTLCSGNKARLPYSGLPPHPHTQEHSPSSPLPPHPLSPLNIALECGGG